MQVRFGQEGPFGLRATLLTYDDTLPVDLVGVSYATLEIIAPPLALREGEAIVLGLVGEGMAEMARVPAIIRGRVELPTARRIVLHVVDPDRLAGQLPPQTQAGFNRRGAFRVIPDSKQPIQCAFRREEGLVTAAAPIISISVTGMGLYVKERNAGVAPGDRLMADMKVPGNSQRVTLIANVRYMIAMPGGTRYGIMFDSRETPQFARQQKTLSQYIMALQRRMLRMSST